MAESTEQTGQEGGSSANLDLDWAMAVRANSAGAKRRAHAIRERSALLGTERTRWLVRALECLDLTTLGGDDTPGHVRHLAARAVAPIGPAALRKAGIEEQVRVASLCVYHNMIRAAVEALAGTSVPVCSVSTGFPAAQISLDNRLDQIEQAVAAGAAEIDVVINRTLVLTGSWEELYAEVAAFRQACGTATMKTILATGELGAMRRVARASRVCMLAGADFIKTSTGKEAVNATLPVGIVMARSIRDFHRETGRAVGLKPAGGIKTAQDALEWLVLVREELGTEWLTPRRFRIGASSVLDSIVGQIEAGSGGRAH